MAGEVNEAVREQENFQKVVDIQKAFEGNVKSIVAEGRLYVRDGSLMKVRRTCKQLFRLNRRLVFFFKGVQEDSKAAPFFSVQRCHCVCGRNGRQFICTAPTDDVGRGKPIVLALTLADCAVDRCERRA